MLHECCCLQGGQSVCFFIWPLQSGLLKPPQCFSLLLFFVCFHLSFILCFFLSFLHFMFLSLFLTPKLRITARMAEKREKTRNFQNSSDFFLEEKKTTHSQSNHKRPSNSENWSWTFLIEQIPSGYLSQKDRHKHRQTSAIKKMIEKNAAGIRRIRVIWLACILCIWSCLL